MPVAVMQWTPVAATLTPAGVMSTPVVVNLNEVWLKGWAVFAQPFFYGICAISANEGNDFLTDGRKWQG